MSLMIAELIQYFFLQIILNRVTMILNFFSKSNLSIHRFLTQRSKTPIEKTITDSRSSRTQLSTTNKNTINNDSLRGDDLKLLMANFGLFSHPDSEKLPEVLNSEDIFNVFEDDEPRLDEVKEAFDAFDENRDGFIDAWELHRVMFVLGLKERIDMEDCRKMIGAFDVNADGRIDFDEFVKLMEHSLC
ncbi:hypothetical protein QVD17_36704 [Tagetes erecta]|uniref:EF-hand domain-containing protein n=1 Tax=Tagetes erecta TaxID=13708 RepID=A0AAD8JSX3_TARER|nr:hypothetical protein QVD17_36704 [Tagetes erecta]